MLIQTKECLSHRLDALASQVRAHRHKDVFLPSFFIWGRPPEGAARFRMGLPVSDNVIQNIPHRSAQKLGFYLIPDVVKLPTCTRHHSGLGVESPLFPQPSYLFSLFVVLICQS